MRFLILFNLITLIFLWLGSSANASVEVNEVNWLKEKDFLVLKVQYEGKIKEFPEIKVVNNKYFFQWPNATVAAKVKLPNDISTKVSTQLNSTNQMSWIFLNNFRGGDPRESNVTIKVKDQTLLLYFPPNEEVLNVQAKKVVNTISDAKVIKVNRDYKNNDNKEQSDYLQYLLSSVAKEGANTNKIGRMEEDNKLQKNNVISNNQKREKSATENTEVSHKGIIGKATSETNFSVMNQKNSFSTKAMGETQWTYLLRVAGSFLGVLLVVLLLAQMFKKIVLGGKGKLGFLNSTQVVEILNTTYIAPKRQLILVRVHDQVVLLSSAENGISFLTEINDLSTLLKKGEKEISGTNFDSNMLIGQSDPNLERKVSLKDYSKINESAPLVEESKIRKALKNKVKTLNAWQ